MFGEANFVCLVICVRELDAREMDQQGLLVVHIVSVLLWSHDTVGFHPTAQSSRIKICGAVHDGATAIDARTCARQRHPVHPEVEEVDQPPPLPCCSEMGTAAQTVAGQ